MLFRSKDLLASWQKKDPIPRFEKVLEKKGWLPASTKKETEARIKDEVAADAAWAEESPMPQGDSAREGVFSLV